MFIEDLVKNYKCHIQDNIEIITCKSTVLKPFFRFSLEIEDVLQSFWEPNKK
jgi:hypothetical protein